MSDTTSSIDTVDSEEEMAQPYEHGPCAEQTLDLPSLDCTRIMSCSPISGVDDCTLPATPMSPPRKTFPIIPILPLHKDRREYKIDGRISSETLRAEVEHLISNGVDVNTRVQLLKEILESEKNYVKNLDLLWKMYYQTLVEGHEDPFQKNKLDVPGRVTNAHKMFPPNLSTVMTLHQAFLRKLEDRYKLFDDESLYFLVIGDLIREMAPFFKVYVTYLSSFERSNMIIRRNRQNQQFDDWLDRRKKLPQSKGLDIGSLLIMPVQRLPRYQLLLKSLLEHTRPDHNDRSYLLESYDLISDITEFQNRRIKDTNNALSLAKLGSRLGRSELIQPSRRIILSGDIYVTGIRSKCTAHLFNDMLLIEKQTSSLSPIFSRKTCYEYHLVEAFISGGDVNALSINSQGSTVQLHFEDFNGKRKWVDAITNVLNELQESETEDTFKIPTSARGPVGTRERRRSLFSESMTNIKEKTMMWLTPRKSLRL
ncbi:hypothetical protein AKO1_013092 [Acrasis kona]|uniref:DH domain-containing protein n=1 Tax=Acrasis kona TaxID=1008807 RepID=A0AAW2YY71_9EUKA